MGFLAPEGTLAEEPPSLWAPLPVGACCPLVAGACDGTVRCSPLLPYPFGDGSTVSLDVATCCQAFWYLGHKTTGNRMSAVNKRCSVYQPRDSQRCPGGLCRSAKAGTPPIGY